MSSLEGEECVTGKTCFPDRTAAERAMRAIRTKGDRKLSTPVRAYRCPHCRWTHVTSMSDWTNE